MNTCRFALPTVRCVAFLLLSAAAMGVTAAEDPVYASMLLAQNQLSSTCRFTQGPRAGQVQSYQGMVQPIPVGSSCTDGQGSFGTAIPDGGGSVSGSGQLSSTCRFNQGPRAGQVQSYKGMVQPIPVGSSCTDGQGSFGSAIADER